MQQRLQEKAYELWEEAGSPEGGEQHFWFQAKVAISQEEAKLDRALAESSPASDPPAAPDITSTEELPPDVPGIRIAELQPTQIRHSRPPVEGWRRRLRAWWLHPAKE